jgi:DNA invertase Pin-like site-specific DNA recombinase
MKEAIGYLRVSTREQGHKRNGLEAQREAIERFAQAEGFNIVQWYEEHESGKGFLDALDRRPELGKALDHAKKLKCSVMVSKLDRFSRDVAFISSLMSRGIAFIVTELGLDVDPFILHLYAALSEKERALISHRTKEGLRKVKERGVRLGNPTNLREAQRKGMESNQARADAFAESVIPIIQTFRDKGFALRAIVKELNDRKISTARGGKWHLKTLQNVLARSSA